LQSERSLPILVNVVAISIGTETTSTMTAPALQMLSAT
jgi:hypothetical protein